MASSCAYGLPIARIEFALLKWADLEAELTVRSKAYERLVAGRDLRAVGG